MMKKRALSFVLATLSLSACNQQAPQPKPSPTAPATDYLARISALTKEQRNATFYRAIEDAGFVCDTVADSMAQDKVQGHPAWDARCSDGQHWTLVLLDDGILQVLKGAPAQKRRVAPGEVM